MRMMYSEESGLFAPDPQDSRRSKLEPHHIVQLISAILNGTVVIILSWQKANSLVVTILFWMAAVTLFGILGRYAIRFVR
jgi:hypothetical protein